MLRTPGESQISFPYSQIMREIHAYDKYGGEQNINVLDTIFNQIQTGFIYLTDSEKEFILHELERRFPQRIQSLGLYLLLMTSDFQDILLTSAKLTYLQFFYGERYNLYSDNRKGSFQNWMDTVPRSLDEKWNTEQQDKISELTTGGETNELEYLAKLAYAEHKRSHIFVFFQYKQVLKRVLNQSMTVSDHTHDLVVDDVIFQDKSDALFVSLMITFAEGAKEILEEEETSS